MIQLSSDPAVSVSYLYSGLFETQEEWSHPHRVIDSYEILYVVAGEVYLEEEGERFSLKAGDVYLLRPDCRHGGYRISRGKTSFYWVHFVTDGWPGLETGLLSVPDSYRFSLLLKQLLHIANTPGYPAYAPDAALAVLQGQGAAATKTEVLCVRLDDRPGELARVMGVMADCGINVSYSYSLISTYIALSVKDLVRAEELLVHEPVELVGQESLAKPFGAAGAAEGGR